MPYVITLFFPLSVCPVVCPVPTSLALQASCAGRRPADCAQAVTAGQPQWQTKVAVAHHGLYTQVHSCANMDSPAGGRVDSCAKVE